MTNLPSFLAIFPSVSRTISGIDCAHASNWFTHLQPIHNKLMVKMTIILFLLVIHVRTYVYVHNYICMQ